MKRWNSEVIGGLFWIAVGLFFVVGAIHLKLGTLRNPGPGFIPLGMASLLLCFSLFTLAKGLIVPTGGISRIPWKRPTLVIASALLYLFLISRVGFFVSTFVLMAILFGFLIRLKRRKWLSVFLCSAATAVAAWLVFSIGLRVPFP
jgi:putative tricarboxylic transport membrane protein